MLEHPKNDDEIEVDSDENEDENEIAKRIVEESTKDKD